MAQYGLLELALLTELDAKNHYDPSELALGVRFTGPGGEVVETGAFWYQAFDPASRGQVGEPGWRARFAPPAAGRWTAEPTLAGQVVGEPLAFDVEASGGHGFLRVNPDNPRHFAFDDGAPFFPIGLNMGWWETDPLRDYEQWLDAFAANGGNTIRVWMAPWSFGLEWDDTGLGNYERRLDEAWYLDELLRMAEERGIYVILVLSNHGQFSETVNAEWDANPYNVANGGPLRSPEAFATDETARAAFKQRVEYIARRWGYSPNLFAWEWWNEVNWTPITEEALLPWYREMTAVLRAADPNDHLVTTSGHEASSAVWDLPEIDFLSKHDYNPRDLLNTAPEGYWLRPGRPVKPVMLAEFAYTTANRQESFDPEGVHLTNGLWATTFSGYAGAGMYWWWDEYVAPMDLWRHFGSLSRFLEGIDVTAYQPADMVTIYGPGGVPGAGGLALRNGDSLLVWARAQRYTAAVVERAYRRSQLTRGLTASPPDFPTLTGAQLSLTGVADGVYDIAWYDPAGGTWLGEEMATAEGGRLEAVMPPFSRQVAARLERRAGDD